MGIEYEAGTWETGLHCSGGGYHELYYYRQISQQENVRKYYVRVKSRAHQSQAEQQPQPQQG